MQSTLSGFSCCTCFLCSFFFFVLRELSCFLDSHLPAWPLDSCSVCQLVASGTLRRREFAGKKREGSSRGTANTPVFAVHPDCPSAEQRKRVSLLIIVFLLFGLWWKECRWKVRFVYHALVCMQAFYSLLEQSIY